MAPHGRYNKTRGRGGGGRGRGRGRGGRGGGGGGGGVRNFQDNRVSFDEVVKTNDKFERYYNTLDIVPSGGERDAFWATLRRELPNSFRFTGSKGHALAVRDNLVNRFFPLIRDIKHNGESVELPTPIAWYPEGLAYRMTTPKNVVRKYEPFKEFQKFLVSETGVGNLSRQEEVSMIPPLLLDVRPEHTVLDLCAAPGSKSAQLIEAIHSGEEDRVVRAIKSAKATNGAASHSEDTASDSGRTTGLLIANDVNYQRAQMLVHQVKRLNSPNLIVTNHDATMFPSIELPTAPPTAGQQKKGKYLKFDRILADVPCSGDGTTRKNPSIWKDWTPQNGLGLYITQTRILTRALQMLKVGGRVVYSTCSMNPVENEAVVSSAIERCGGIAKVRLIDCSNQLPKLLRRPGLQDWSIMTRDGRMYESFAEAEQYEADGSRIVPGMFAPEPEEQIPLNHCMRVYPHQQDTGGFFIAVLEKLGEVRAKPESESKSMKRDWVFTTPEDEPVVASNPATTADSLVDSLVEDMDHPRPPMETQGASSSAAARPNNAEVSDVVSGAGTKRSAPEDEQGFPKRIKVANDELNSDTVAKNVNGRPVPPAIGKALDVTEASHEVDVNGKHNDAAGIQPPPRKRRRDNEPANEESFKYLAPSHQELESIYTFYQLHPSFPRDRFLVRNPAGDPVKGIYYSSQLAKDILTANEGRGMKFVHGGVKMFMKQDVQGQANVCRWRIQTEGLPIVEGWVGEERTVRLHKRTTLRKLLVEMFPKVGNEESPEGQGWKALGEIGEQVLNMGMGCCVMRVEVSDEEDGFKEPIVLPLWRSLHSLNLMLPKEERKAMLLRIFNEDVELINHSDQSRTTNSIAGEPRESVAAEEGAKQLQARTQDNAVEGDAGGVSLIEKHAALGADGGSVAADSHEAELEDAAAARVEDATQQAQMEIHADEAVRTTSAMPEGDADGDDMNTTI